MLIDTNIIIEIAKKQEFHQDCLDLLKIIKRNRSNEEVYITSFALHAIEAMISKKEENFLREILILIHQGNIKVFNMDISDDMMVLAVMKDLQMDFDDTIQYIAANKLGTYIVTFDKGFQDKGLEVKTPAQVLKKILK